jgi:two-component system chemotaxis response regulator CheY
VVINLGGKIVVADDASFMRMMLKNILVQGGYEVIGEADNGAKAIEKYFELKPDLITLDITMPEMDGVTACKEILSRDSNANVIMCSAMGQQAIVVEAIMAGAKDFIIKPFQTERVIEAVKRVIG